LKGKTTTTINKNTLIIIQVDAAVLRRGKQYQEEKNNAIGYATRAHSKLTLTL
jgi:hypothetical protein